MTPEPHEPVRGRLWLVPTPLDFGIDRAASALDDTLPLGTVRRAAALKHWVVEQAKTARAFLKRVDAVVPLAAPLQALDIVELPRAQKGVRPTPAAPAGVALRPLLKPALSGEDIGLMSEAGMPGVADPGAELVAAAHACGIEVIPLTGPSALLLAVAASGLHGQSFAFVGYLPVDAGARATRIRELEALSRRATQTQLMIETPYRNEALLAALLATLQPATRLSVSCGLTVAGGFTRSDTVAGWRASPRALPKDIPAVFSLLAA